MFLLHRFLEVAQPVQSDPREHYQLHPNIAPRDSVRRLTSASLTTGNVQRQIESPAHFAQEKPHRAPPRWRPKDLMPAALRLLALLARGKLRR